MWPTGIPKDLLFFAMMAHRPGYKLNSNAIQASVAQKRAPPKHNAHTSNTHTCAHAHTYAHINRKIHHLVLPVTSCLEGKSCHSNKPQKRKLGCQVATVVSQYLKKYCNVGTQTRQTQIMFICFINNLQPSLSTWQFTAWFLFVCLFC